MGTNLISGLSSGFDWKTMVDQLISIDHQRVDTVVNKQKKDQAKLIEWQALNTKLLALKTAAANLKDPDALQIYKTAMTTDSSSVAAKDLLSMIPSANAVIGSYSLKINNLATAQKVSSGSFSGIADALGAPYAGDLLLNGTLIAIDATDTLTTLRDKINNANAGSQPTGVTASIITYGQTDNRLILTSDQTGQAGIDISNGGALDILTALGFTDTSRTAKNHISGADQSDSFTSVSASLKSLLGLTTTQTSGAGDIVVNGNSVGAIDLSTDTLTSLQTKFAAAGVTVSLTTATDNNQVSYRLMVEGVNNTYTDKNNILETLGFIKGGVTDVAGVAGDWANTSGGAAITAATLIKDIDGYTGYLNTDYIHLEGTDTDGNGVADDTFILSDATTVTDLLNKIETLFGDVTAAITGDGKLVVTDNTPGASPLALKIGVKNTGGTDDNTLLFDANSDLGSATSLRMRQLEAGADASVTLEGVTVTRSSNTIDDLLGGVTLNLLKADPDTTISLNVGRDADAIMTKINTFVTNYNSISSYISSQTSYDNTKKQTGGILFGDGTLASVKSDLTSLLTQTVWGVSSSYATLGLIGISVDRAGQLAINSDKLRGYLQTNFSDISKLFASHGTTIAGSLEYLSHGSKTAADEYAVHVSTAATRSASAPSDNTSLAADEILTITEGDNNAAINLTAGLSMAQIVNAVNSELTTVYTQALTSAGQLYSDALHTTVITAGTKWNSIYDNGGVSANLVNGDTISFTGTGPNGSAVSGSYTITDIAEDSVQGLLSAVESSFSNQVKATINPSGQIVITDSSPGTSRIALTFDFAQAHNFDTGSLATTNANGVTGRNAMDITAAADAGDHLVLTHNIYGTGHTFTIHQENDLLWTGGDQTATDGVDVAGTINGEAATGTGQILKGDSGEDTVDGLRIKYTGTIDDTDAGTVKLTLGIGELFDRVLFNISDSLEGYTTFKQASIQTEISGYTTQIDDMEARLERKREMLTNRFVAMEMALQKIQSQSAWLTAQTKAAADGWYKGSSSS